MNRLALTNKSGKALILIAGEMILGGKQDRIVSFGGIGLLCALAYVKDWSAKLDKKPARVAEDGVTPVRKMGPSILNPTPRDKDKNAA